MIFSKENKVSMTADAICTIGEEALKRYSATTEVKSEESRRAFLDGAVSGADGVIRILNEVLDGKYNIVPPMSAIDSTKARVAQGPGEPWFCQQRDGFVRIG
jgi:hypothetical protein